MRTHIFIFASAIVLFPITIIGFLWQMTLTAYAVGKVSAEIISGTDD